MKLVYLDYPEALIKIGCTERQLIAEAFNTVEELSSTDEVDRVNVIENYRYRDFMSNYDFTNIAIPIDIFIEDTINSALEHISDDIYAVERHNMVSVNTSAYDILTSDTSEMVRKYNDGVYYSKGDTIIKLVTKDTHLKDDLVCIL